MELIDNFLSNEECESLIGYYKYHSYFSWKYATNKTIPLTIDIRDGKYQSFKDIQLRVKNICGNDLTCYEYELVKWPWLSKHDWHTDYKGTKYFAIVYLNDNYLGGRTVVGDEKVKSKGTLLILKDPDKISHMVERVYLGTRYTLAMWFE